MSKRRPTGTKEWAKKNMNICRGCRHKCRYCYARFNALRYKRIRRSDEWEEMVITKKLEKNYRKRSYRVMFPSSHDITPEILPEVLEFLRQYIKPGNDILIVSKPHYDCIKAICDEFNQDEMECDDGTLYKEHIEFRFTIGSTDNDILEFWEPGAPSYDERLRALKYSYQSEYMNSVSCEPMLDDNPVKLFYELKPWTNGTIWMGKMRQMGHFKPDGTFVEERVSTFGWTGYMWGYWWLVYYSQTDDRIADLYYRLKDEPSVRWKDSVKKVLRLPLPAEAGLDE